jgi:hypothetical protein
MEVSTQFDYKWENDKVVKFIVFVHDSFDFLYSIFHFNLRGI